MSTVAAAVAATTRIPTAKVAGLNGGKGETETNLRYKELFV